MLPGLDQAHLFRKRRGRTENESFSNLGLAGALVPSERALEPEGGVRDSQAD
jgi:hypothetical protein